MQCFTLATIKMQRNPLYNVKSNSHAPNLHACIIYIHVNILPVCIFAHGTQIHTGVNLHTCKLTPRFDQM